MGVGLCGFQLAVPDATSVMKLPWNVEVAWVASDLYMNGALVQQSPRQVLKNQVSLTSLT
jgi:glutamine synthetase